MQTLYILWWISITLKFVWTVFDNRLLLALDLPHGEKHTSEACIQGIKLKLGVCLKKLGADISGFKLTFQDFSLTFMQVD